MLRLAVIQSEGDVSPVAEDSHRLRDPVTVVFTRLVGQKFARAP